MARKWSELVEETHAALELVEETPSAPAPEASPEEIAVEAPAPTVVTSETPEAPVARVRIINPSLVRKTHVPLSGGPVRLGPKESITVLVSELTGETRRVEGEGAIYIRNL